MPSSRARYANFTALRVSAKPEEALKLAVQIASAMKEAHSKSILHRDLKPANIPVTVKVLPKFSTSDWPS